MKKFTFLAAALFTCLLMYTPMDSDAQDRGRRYTDYGYDQNTQRGHDYDSRYTYHRDDRHRCTDNRYDYNRRQQCNNGRNARVRQRCRPATRRACCRAQQVRRRPIARYSYHRPIYGYRGYYVPPVTVVRAGCR